MLPSRFLPRNAMHNRNPAGATPAGFLPKKTLEKLLQCNLSASIFHLLLECIRILLLEPSLKHGWSTIY